MKTSVATIMRLVTFFIVSHAGQSFLSPKAIVGGKHGNVVQRQWQLLKASGADASTASNTEEDAPPPTMISGVVAPLQYQGPYACLSLVYPHLDHAILDFILDTGANVNSIDEKLVQKYQLPLVEGIPLPEATAGMGGSFTPGDMVIVGDCSLAGLPPEQSHIVFMKNMTAAALPHASPLNTAGLLGSIFISMFAGVEFDWYGTDGDPPTFIFYFGPTLPEQATTNMIRVPMTQFFQLFAITIQVNGVEIPALLDTGSPITVLSEKAAQQVGISSTLAEPTVQIPKKAVQQQSIGDDSLNIGGVDGRPMQVLRSESPVEIQLGSGSLGEGPIYIGDIPAMSFFESAAQEYGDNIGDSNTVPVAILGMDFLRMAYRIILRADPCELLWEVLDDSKPVYSES